MEERVEQLIHRFIKSTEGNLNFEIDWRFKNKLNCTWKVKSKKKKKLSALLEESDEKEV